CRRCLTWNHCLLPIPIPSEEGKVGGVTGVYSGLPASRGAARLTRFRNPCYNSKSISRFRPSFDAFGGVCLELVSPFFFRCKLASSLCICSAVRYTDLPLRLGIALGSGLSVTGSAFGCS
ncbi:hypothetical protein KC19_3G251400, partial [Ceratodon purpureus]